MLLGIQDKGKKGFHFMINSVSNFKASNHISNINSRNCSFAGRPSVVNLDGEDVYYDSSSGKSQNYRSGLSLFQKVGVVLGLVGSAFGGFLAGNANKSTDVDSLNIEIPPAYTENAGSDYYSNTYGCPVEILYVANGVQTEAEFSNLSQLKIPHKFELFTGALKEKQDKLYDKKLSYEERSSLEQEIVKLQNKISRQEEAAIAYQDGDWVYFYMNKTVNAEEFKDIYGIEDKALRRYNDLDYGWGSTSNGPFENDTYYRDYTGAPLKVGKIYKVTIDDINLPEN